MTDASGGRSNGDLEAAHRRDDSQFNSAFSRARVQIEIACSMHDEWPDRVAAGIGSAVHLAASDPGTAFVLTAEPLSSGADGIARLRELADHFGLCLQRGRALHPERKPPEVLEFAFVAGLASLIAQRLVSGEQSGLPAEAQGLICLALTPYLGFVKASAVARRRGTPDSRRIP